jgi:16S rRNA (guanine966-N2)-methyltransferase
VTRIIAGRAGSLRIEVPSGPTRPTSDRVREAMFSAIEHLLDLEGVRVLDLYAGSGALGLEAVSRGATSAVFVDSSKKAGPVLATNIGRIIAALGPGLTLDAVSQQALAYCLGLTPGDSFDLVVMDPPYDTSNEEVEQCLAALTEQVSPDALIVVERGKKTPEPAWPDAFDVQRTKTYGDTVVYYLSPRR